jgi:hypothetical protein
LIGEGIGLVGADLRSVFIVRVAFGFAVVFLVVAFGLVAVFFGLAADLDVVIFFLEVAAMLLLS